MNTRMHYFPIALPFLFLLFAFAAAAMWMIQLGVLEYAYERIGIRHEYVFALLLLELLGSYVNIPVAELPPEEIVSGREVAYFGMRYVVPAIEERPATIVAINVGGAVIPVALSVYLLLRNRIFGTAAIGTVIVALITQRLAQPVRGVGIALPTLVPPLVAATVASLLSRGSTPALAYVCGTIGTVVGADLLNIGKVQGLGAPVASIGGAGTFDGIFLTGILAVLLA